MAQKIFNWTAAVLLTALYGYLVFAAVGNLIQLPELAANLGLSINGTGWFWLVLGVALPVVGFGLALLLGRRKSAGAKLLLLTTGLAVVSLLQLEISLMVSPIGFFV